MTKKHWLLESQCNLLNLFIGVTLIMFWNYLYHQHALFSDVSVRKDLFVFIELHVYVSLGYLVLYIITVVVDMVT